MQYDQKFMDKVRVWALGGNGGQGSVAISRENYGSPAPDGGSGGDGGSVMFYSSGRITSLHDLRRAHFKGNSGKSGKPKQRNGRNGSDCKFLVPLGTEIYEIKKGMKFSASQRLKTVTPELEELSKVADLDEEGQSYLIAEGGKGGQGNNANRRLVDP